jgi:o-succinylbenzoate synthase
MKVKNVTYSKYKYPFITPILTSKSTLNFREGIILKLETEEGYFSFGEASPLPDFGSESIEEAEACLKKIVGLMSSNILPKNFEKVEPWLNDFRLTPTIRFAFEQALFELFLKNTSIQMNYNSEANIPVNALLNIKTKEITLNEVSEKINNSFDTIKFKTGVNSFENEFEVLKEVRKQFPELKLRLDVNGKWDIETALKSFSKLEELNIEYVEQPVKNLEDLIHVTKNSSVPIAADESVRTIEDATRIIKNGSIKFLVIKPMLLGGFFNTKKILELAKGKCEIIISSSLETNLGFRFLTFIASQCDLKIAHGLSTSNLFKNDEAQNFFPLEDGRIKFSMKRYSQQLKNTIS